jgi:large subunit ribosomal protein L33
MGERVRVALVCSECDARNYQTTKSRTRSERLEMKKYCPRCEKHTVHRESK